MSFHKFLYPSEEDLYKLVRFLLKKLSELPKEVGEATDKREVITSTLSNENCSKYTFSKDLMEKGDDHEVFLNVDGVRTRLEDFRLSNELPESLNSTTVDASANGTNNELSTKRLRNPTMDASVNEESAGQMEDRHDSALEQKLKALIKQSSEIEYKIGKLRSQEKVLMKEVTVKTEEAQCLENEHELLKSAAEMAFDDQQTTDFYIMQLNEQVDARRVHLGKLETQWDALGKTLEEKRSSLEETLYETKPEALEKLKKLKDIELEIEVVLSEIKKREEEQFKLSSDLENQSKLAPRRSYVERITEITKNSRKQDADIERILEETRELQLESNSIQERLHRTYAVVDETVFREAKKDPVGRQAYRLLTSIHESFEQISDKILTTDRIRREVAEHEAKLSALARRSFNVNKLQDDLGAIRRENEFIERQLQHS
ncbi:hypothetical protein NMG60_11002061 [Bertholletia excelsa]